MLITPAIVALQLVALGVAGTVLLASGFAWRILRRWNIGSGSELQLRLERRTYLISTLLGFALGAELLSLLLFVHTAESLSSQFVGAMCATGVLNVNAFGFPTLLSKIAVFFLAALWLLLNRVDNRGYDYPLVRAKYGLLLAIAPLTVVELVTQTGYFLGLEPEVITSCCGSLFGADGRGVASELAGLPPWPTLLLFYGMGGLIAASGGWLLSALTSDPSPGGRGEFRSINPDPAFPHLAFPHPQPLSRGERGAEKRGKLAGMLFAGVSLLGFGVAIAAIIAVLSLYVYENPNHHCPFCLSKAGYDHVGYALYIPLFAATAAGLGAGTIALFRHVASLQAVVPGEVRRLTWLALGGFGLFYGLATWLMARSNLILLG